MRRTKFTRKQIRRIQNGDEKLTKLGRKSGYDPLYHPHAAFEACSAMGATDKNLCGLFNISNTTLHNWKRKYPEFRTRTKKGKDYWDTNVVERAYHRRAVGYDYSEEQFEMKPIFDENGELIRRAKVKVGEKTKHQPADVKACEGWLYNRDKIRWVGLKETKISGDLNVQNDVTIAGAEGLPDELTTTAQVLDILIESGVIRPSADIEGTQGKSAVN